MAIKWLIGMVLVGLLLAYGISCVWPAREWNRVIVSPDGRYDLVVLRSNAAAFSDFCYSVYIFPADSAPQEMPKNTRVLYFGRWRQDRNLVYSGCTEPVLHWADSESVEVRLSDTSFNVSSFSPVKQFASSGRPILFSLVFNRPK